MVMETIVRVTRDVSINDPHNYAGRDVAEGETFYIFRLTTYGCVDNINGIALSVEFDKYPFFEFPVDAIEETA